MNNNYFVIEQNNNYVDGAILIDNDGNILHEEVMSMSYDEIKNYDKFDDFLDCIIDASESHFGTNNEHTILNLVDSENTLIWGILFGIDPDDPESIRYCFVDWGKDGQIYKYQKNQEI